MPNEQTLKFRVLAPLINFNWSGDDFLIANLCTIKRMHTIPDFSWCEDRLSKVEKDDLYNVLHWLSFEQASDDKLGASEKINIFLLLLWIVLPTRTYVKIKLEDHYGPSRFLNQFMWIDGIVEDKIETKHLAEMRNYVDGILEVCNARQKLWNSLVLTFNGCTTEYWQVAFLCFSAAAEGILTYSNKPGITKRIAKSFACLTKTRKSERDSAYQDFIYLYNLRSDIMHGQAVNLTNPDENLEKLAQFTGLLRSLWKIILSNRVIGRGLEKDNAGKKAWLIRNEQGYKPPAQQ